MSRSVGRMARAAIAVVAVLVAAGAAVVLSKTPAVAAVTCDRNATTSSFASEVSAASAGQTICLASGSYGSFGGTNKAITIRPQDGATPTMSLSFGSGDQSFTIDGGRSSFAQSWGIRVSGGDISAGVKNITVKNTDVTGGIGINGPTNAGLVFDHNLHHDINGFNATAAFHLSYGSSTPSGVTIKNSLFRDMSSDAIQTGLALVIIDNEFSNIDPRAAGGSSELHTDAIQLYSGCSGGTGTVIARNYFHGGEQMIGAFDGTCANVIEDNVIQQSTNHYLVMGGDNPASTVTHNTLIGPGGTQQLAVSSKSGARSITRLRDNIAPGGIDLSGGVAGQPTENHHNLCRNSCGGQNLTGTPQYVGGANPTTYAGFKLAAGSPGKGAASDGQDVGARIGSSPAPAPTPTPSPSPSPSPTPPPSADVAADALWTPPSGAKVSTAVTLEGTGSKGNAPISCTWSFEDQSGGTVFETATGCKLQKAFKYSGTKYAKLSVRDQDGDTDASKQSFTVSAASAPPADTAADALWTPPSGARVGVAVTLDGTGSKGDAPITCTWSFEDQSGGTVFETATGCKLQKAFRYSGTKYVRLSVRDQGGDTDASKQSFTVKA